MKNILLSVFFIIFANTMAQKKAYSEDINIINIQSFSLIPETMELTLTVNDSNLDIFSDGAIKKVEKIVKNGDDTAIYYPEDNVKVTAKKVNNYLSMTIESLLIENSFQFPQIYADSFILPIGEGKYIPAKDEFWKFYLKEREIDTIEGFSMSFFALEKNNLGIIIILEDNFNNTIKFDTENIISLTLSHDFPRINNDKKMHLRIYVTNNDPVSIAKTYRNYIIENKKLITLEEKAEYNSNIRKLYGAPHIYLWDEMVISEPDINWTEFRNKVDAPIFQHITKLMEAQEAELFKDTLNQIRNQNYVDNYQKNIICQILSRAILSPKFYNYSEITESTDESLIKKSISKRTRTEIIQLNKQLLHDSVDGVFKPIETWANDRTVDLIKKLHSEGISKLWLGLHSWEQGFIKPELVSYAVDQGYLIGPYDSYHSIHKPGNEQWLTASFTDMSLYENATIEDKHGKKIEGFQNIGRKINPTLSLPSVDIRIKSIMSNNIPFNTWFIDCDATGEIYDDYSPDHITTKKQDMIARLERMAFIRDNYNMVIGSEGGNDFAANVIAFAHGIELPSFSWMDIEMSKNKKSEYYTGRYYSPKGGVAEKFAKTVPIKEQYYNIFLSPYYNLPLFKLVYNESVITSNHWEWSNLKIDGNIKERFVYNILYNVPPLYHLDKYIWEHEKDTMIEQIKTFASFGEKVSTKEMTNFKILSEDRLLQLSEYGNGEIIVIANFSKMIKKYLNHEIQPQSFIIINEDYKHNHSQ